MNSEKIYHRINTGKNYKKGFVFLMAKTLKDIRSHSLKLAKVFSQKPSLFKVNPSLYSNAFQYSGAITLVRNLASP